MLRATFLGRAAETIDRTVSAHDLQNDAGPAPCLGGRTPGGYRNVGRLGLPFDMGVVQWSNGIIQLPQPIRSGGPRGEQIHQSHLGSVEPPGEAGHATNSRIIARLGRGAGVQRTEQDASGPHHRERDQ